MKVYVSWASVKEAESGALVLGEWADSLNKQADKDKDKELLESLKLVNTLPEYEDYLSVQADAPQYDNINQDLLAVSISTPQLGRTVKYQLSKRLAGAGKLSVALAVRSHLLKTFSGEWEYDSEKPKGNVTLVGLPGIRQFLQTLQQATAVTGNPFPPCFDKAQVLVLPDNVHQVLDAAAVNSPDDVKQKYVKVLTGWRPRASASRDNLVAVSYGMLMGWEVNTDGDIF
tara:strand:+ start:381 stop:1067 length:687 start_codon:yes stop_codon:yes gene_type:complete